MSSTEADAARAAALAAFHRRHLAPLAGSLGADALATAGSGDAASFYRKRAATRMSRADFELAMADEEQIVHTLRTRWRGTPLEAVPEPLLRLAREFEDAPHEARVSAFVYEMF